MRGSGGELMRVSKRGSVEMICSLFESSELRYRERERVDEHGRKGRVKESK